MSQLSGVVVGRQAIQNRAGDVVGYELLFRGGRGAETSESLLSGDEMTAEVVFGALNIGLDHVVGTKMVFCNADRGVLVGDMQITLPPERTIIEILETVVLDDEVLVGCRKLTEQGYRLALDDFVWFDGAEALLELATFVKIDVQAVRGAELAELVEKCRRYDVQLLAEKIETVAELKSFRDLGFELFQGYLLDRPLVVAGRTLEPGQASRVRMATVLLNGDFDLDALDDLLRTDPGLAYQVMQLASLGRPGEFRRPINTIRDALVYVGARRMQNWMALMLARPERSSESAAFAETLIRARACELLAQKALVGHSRMGFAAGLLSALDLLFGIPADELRAALPIADALADAAFGEDSELGRIVRDAIDYQLGTPGRKLHSDLCEADLDEAFGRAFVWTMQTAAALEI